jgi:hypothetical protein
MVEVKNKLGGVLALPLADSTGGYLVEEVEGLDPVKATLVTSDWANLDGAQYQDSSRTTRNIIIRLKLKPNFTTSTVRGLRNRLYGFFMPKSEVTLHLYYSDGLVVQIDGRVETCDAPSFTKEPRVDVSIICFDPDFIDPEPVIISGETTDSTTSESGRFLIPYEGTVDTGVKFTLEMPWTGTRTLSEFTIYHRKSGDIALTMDFEAPLSTSDKLIIVTIPGQKSVTLTRGLTDTSLLWAIAPQSDWIQLAQGENYIRVYTSGTPIPWTIEYTTRYGGL